MSHELGPLAGLEGIWEGEKGTDTAPDDDPANQEINKYRERMTFEATGLVANHAQKLYGQDEPFHHTDENTLTRVR